MLLIRVREVTHLPGGGGNTSSGGGNQTGDWSSVNETPQTPAEQAASNYNTAYSEEKEKRDDVVQKQNELDKREYEKKQLESKAKKACADDPKSEACRLAKITLGTYEAQVKAKEDDLNKAKSEYNSATVKSKKSKINMLEKQKEETDQRMNDLIEQAQITCAGNSSSQSCIELTKQINELSQKLSGIIGELDKLKQ